MILIPSSLISRHLPFNLSEKVIMVPTLIALALPHKHSQIESAPIFKIRTSTLAPVSSLVPYNLAGITLELFLTRTSPSCK